MARKLPPLPTPAKVSFCVGVNFCYHPISTAAQIRHSLEYEKLTENTPQIESAIRFLKKKLNPDRLNSVLDSTRDSESALRIFKWASSQKAFRPTAGAYSRMIVKLGVSGNFEDIEGLLRETMKMTKLNKDEVKIDLGFGYLIDYFCGQQRLSEALRVIEVMNLTKCQPPPVSACNKLLGALIEKRDYQSVLFAYKEIVKAGTIPSVETLNFLLDVLYKTHRVDAAMGQYDSMNKKGCIPNSKTFEIIIGGLCLNNRVGEALEVLQKILASGCHLDCSFYNSTIHLLCKFDQLGEGIRLYRTMLASEILPNSLLFGSLIVSCCKNLQMNDATRLFSDMLSLGLHPANEMYVVIVNGYCKLGELGKAEKFLVENPASDYLPYNCLLEEHCNRGSFSEARRYLDDLVKRDLCNVNSWNVLIRTLCEKGWLDKSFEFLNRMVVFSHSPDSATYSALIIGFCKLRRYYMALELFAKASARGWCLDTAVYSVLIDTLCYFDKIKEAIEVFEHMCSKRCNLSVSCFNLLIQKICLMGKVGLAISLRSFASCSGTSSCSITYAMIMHTLLQYKEARSMLVLFAQMLVEGCYLDMNVYCVLVTALCTKNMTKDASVFFDHMVTAGFIPDSETTDAFLSCVASHSHLHLVACSLEKIMSQERAFSYKMYNFVVNGLCREGYKDKACKFLDRMLELGYVPDPATHALLFGSNFRESAKVVTKEIGAFDRVTDILTYGLDEI